MSVRDFISYINTTQIHRVAVILFIVLLAAGMGVGFSVASTDARNAASKDYDRQLSVFTELQMELTSHFTKAGSLAATIGAFASALATRPANMSAPIADRMEYLNDAGFHRLGRQIHIPGVTALVLLPGGIMTQMYPPGSVALGFDALGHPTYTHVLPKINSSTAAIITGPNKFASRPGSGMLFWFPVHVNDTASMETFWGASFVIVSIDDLFANLNISSRAHAANMDFVMWYTTVVNGPMPSVLAQSDLLATDAVINKGMRMQLPISEEGRNSYMAIYPKGGPTSSNIEVGTAVIIAAATVIGSAIVVFVCVYALAYAYFLFRHRRAPASRSNMCVAALTLRGAQPFADHAPLTAIRMFNEFIASVKSLAIANKCYPVCEIGDRCVFVVAKEPESIMKLAQAAVRNIAIESRDTSAIRKNSIKPQSDARQMLPRSATATATSVLDHSSQVSEEMTQSSLLNNAVCHASVACHDMAANCVYDPTKDVYFYGTAAQIGKVCGALDMAKCEEVCWTVAFETRCPQVCRGAAGAALTSHMVSENGEAILHVASWCKETGDERDNEDPSTAMAALTDAHVRRMAVLVSEGKSEAKERKRKGEATDTRSGSSNQSNEATTITRVATLLQIAIISGDEKNALETIRRIVSEEKGVVVSAHESVIVAAFNLLSAGGHHQIRAADTVMRLRDALPRTHFACSILHGKISALVMEGLVMCSGEAVAHGRHLLHAAIALATPHSSSPSSGLPSHFSLPTDKLLNAEDNGICLLCCHSELSSSYDCEAADLISFGAGKPKVAFLLAHRKATKATDDEWMYRLKDEEDQSPFAVVNAVFSRIAAHDLEEAKRIWFEYQTTEGGAHLDGVSKYAKASVARHLSQV